MPAGTITLTNNSAAVTGSGTAFTTELKVNDFVVAVVGGVTYTLGIKSIESDTALTLNTAYNGPDASGSAWTPIPNATLVGITAQVAADVAKAIRGLNLDKANWQQVFSATGEITVTLPDGSTYTGPAWNSFTSSLETLESEIDSLAESKLDKDQNLDDVSDKSQARTNLDLKSAALADITGAVSSGAIIETGTNANGTYTKWADGTVICRITRLSISDLTNTFRMTVFWTFPAPFIDDKFSLSASLQDFPTVSDGNTDITRVQSNSRQKEGTVLSVYRNAMGSVLHQGDIVYIDCIAIGRWK